MIGAYAIGSYPIAGVVGYRVFSEKLYSSYLTLFTSLEEEEEIVWSSMDTASAVLALDTSSIEVTTGVAGWASAEVGWYDPEVGWIGETGRKRVYVPLFSAAVDGLSRIEAVTASSVDTNPIGTMTTSKRLSSSTLRTYSPFLGEYVE